MKQPIFLTVFLGLLFIAGGPWSISTAIAQQPGDTLWTGIYGGEEPDYGYSIQQTTDGGYITLGKTGSFGAGSADAWLLKTDANGDTLWTRTYGGDEPDYGYSIQQTTDGGYIIAGKTSSFGADSIDVWLLKTDADGDTLWTRIYGGSGIDIGYTVQQTTDGGYIIIGETDSFGAGECDVYLVKTDSSGDTLWTRTYGGWGFERSLTGKQTIDGGYIIAARQTSFGPENTWLLKTDANGDTLWTRFYGSGGHTSNLYSIQQTTDGGFIVTGGIYWYGRVGTYAWLLKTDADGNTLWTGIYPYCISTPNRPCWDCGTSVQQTMDGGYIIAGYSRYQDHARSHYDAFLFKTDANGDTLWSRIYGPFGWDEELFMCVEQTDDGGYIATGSKRIHDPNEPNSDNFDVWLVKVAGEQTGIVEEDENVPSKFITVTNYPNPFNAQTNISFNMGSAGEVRLDVYNVLGERVATLVDGHVRAGKHTITWDASKYPSGIYFYKLTAPEKVFTKKMTLLK